MPFSAIASSKLYISRNRVEIYKYLMWGRSSFSCIKKHLGRVRFEFDTSSVAKVRWEFELEIISL